MRSSSARYKPVRATEDLSSGPESPRPNCPHCGSQQTKVSTFKAIVAVLWSPTVVASAAIIGTLLLFSWQGRQTQLWSKHDFAPARHLLKSNEVTFSGTAAFHDNGSAYRTSRVGEPQYVGTPSKEIDEAWDALIQGRYFYITEDEARQTWPDTYQQYYRDEYGYRAGLDVLHTLHCVNMLRKTIYVDYYPHYTMGKPFQQYHVAVQCQGDLTPIPVRWFESAGRRFIDSDQTHRCRDFSAIRDWATSRYNGSLAVHVDDGPQAPE
ncbi:Cyclochlorotine biosynthesis protein [Teratosphaeria destructans]|uniref:Cyclochlorotine biosynthesis protein n=1 Tax=Teratosphaeria destructans TaxID=418781 RepID=A0A9W7SNC9_9PEZI|nr:Cyclochlorotine biosynthesis protein [Teratosphaeria destructans]